MAGVPRLRVVTTITGFTQIIWRRRVADCIQSNDDAAGQLQLSDVADGRDALIRIGFVPEITRDPLGVVRFYERRQLPDAARAQIRQNDYEQQCRRPRNQFETSRAQRP